MHDDTRTASCVKPTQEQIEFLRKIECCGVQFFINVPTVCGGKQLRLSASDVASCIDDIESAYAKAVGLTVTQYRDWISSDGSIRCSGTNVDGTRCKNVFAFQLDAKEWLARVDAGECCHVHGGSK